MQTYLNQLHADEARIDQECPVMYERPDMAAERAGRFSALARYYATSADMEAATRQRTLRDPASLVLAYTSARQLDGDFEAIVADLLDAIRATLGGREFSAERGCLEEAAADLRYMVKARELRRAEDLDAPAAAQSDEAYDRKIDAGLIGRSEFLPAKV